MTPTPKAAPKTKPDINRMADPVRPASPAQATLADPDVLECPYPTYQVLREQAPVFKDPMTGMYVISRYADQRRIALDYDNFSNARPSNDHANLTGIARVAYERFVDKGWVPGESLAARDLLKRCEEQHLLRTPLAADDAESRSYLAATTR